MLPDPSGARLASKIANCGTTEDGARWHPVGDAPAAIGLQIAHMQYPTHGIPTLISVGNPDGTTLIVFFVEGKPKKFFLVPHPEEESRK